MIQRTICLMLASLLAGGGCNLYTELDAPIDGPDATDQIDAGADSGPQADADTVPDLGEGGPRWRKVEIAIGDSADSPTPWRIKLSNAVAMEDFGPGGSWLRVFDSEGNLVPFQIESWISGAHVVWVNVDPGGTRTFWFRYGVEPEETRLPARQVWDPGGYEHVWGFASDPALDQSDWVGTRPASPVEGGGTLEAAGGRIAVCVEDNDGWTVGGDPSFGIARGSAGATFEVTYRPGPDGSTGRLISTERLCNGIDISLTNDRILGGVLAGTSCDPGFAQTELAADREADPDLYHQAVLTVEPTQPGYSVALYLDGSRVATGSLNSMNSIGENPLQIATFDGMEEHSPCIDQVHVAQGVRSPADVEASYRGVEGLDVSLGAPMATPTFMTR